MQISISGGHLQSMALLTSHAVQPPKPPVMKAQAAPIERTGHGKAPQVQQRHPASGQLSLATAHDVPGRVVTTSEGERASELMAQAQSLLDSTVDAPPESTAETSQSSGSAGVLGTLSGFTLQATTSHAGSSASTGS